MAQREAMLNPDGTFRQDAGGANKVEIHRWNHQLGPRGRRRLVDKVLLRVDVSYQRKQSIDKARSIARDFFWPAFGVLTVSERDSGELFVLDGGHRTLAATLRPDLRRVPCYVFSGLSRKEEARAFVAINKHRRPPSGIQVYAAQIVAGDKTAREVRDLLKGRDIVVKRGTGAHQLNAVQTAIRLQEGGGLEDVLLFVDEVWPEHDKRLIAQVLQGVHRFGRRLGAHPKLTLLDVEVLRRFGRSSLTALLQQAMDIQRYSSQSQGYSFAEAMALRWNKGRRSRRIPLNGEA